MRYTKQAITLAEQIKTLHERGLFIEDDAEAIEVLEHISYFRLADYWRPLESDLLPTCLHRAVAFLMS